MKNMIKRIAALTLAIMLISVPASVLADTGYTYNYDDWEETQ